MPINPSYKLINIKDVKDNVIIMENGGLRGILAVPGVNIELMNEEDQNLILNQFKSLLDGLDFNIEIFILSRFENLDEYLKILQTRFEEETNELIKFQIEEYMKFLEEYLDTHRVMKKMFFVVVPYDPPTSELPGPFAQKMPQTTYEENLFQLETRINYVSQILTNIGLQPIRLNNFEILELLFECYNPNLKYGQVPKQILEKLTEFLEK